MRAYLDVARDHPRRRSSRGADAIYPGYGFLSENPELAEAAREAGITFIGPPSARARDGRQQGHREGARHRGGRAGPQVDSGQPRHRRAPRRRRRDRLPDLRQGGRGRRRTRHAPGRQRPRTCARPSRPRCARPTARSATRPCSSSRRCSAPGTSRCRSSPTSTGETLHLFERDCSVQRRHQKVVEIAPAPNLDEDTRQALYRDAIAFAKSIGYVNAGTVEFLARHRGGARGRARLHRDEPAHPGRAHRDRGGHRRRPRAVADAHRRRARPSPSSACSRTTSHLRGAALQCRITTEDPTAGFRPDTGKITTYRSPGGARHPARRRNDRPGRADQPPLRLDAREADLPRARLPGRRHAGPSGLSPSSASAACRRTSRSCRPCSKTPSFVAGDLSTSFIDERPELLRGPRLERPRHEDPQLARRRHGQPAERRAAGRHRTRLDKLPAIDLDDRRPGRLAPAAARARPGGLRRRPCARRPPSP